LEEFKSLKRDDRIKENDTILIFYAGHGSEADAPAGWAVPGSKIQLVLPVDYGKKLNGEPVQAIPDRTIGRLIDDLAEAKGNNIVCGHPFTSFSLTAGQVVIFDCCYSGSGSRVEHFVERSVKARYRIPPDLDRSIWEDASSHRGVKYEPNFLRMGLRSHVFLAACSAQGKAYEDRKNEWGVFSHALFSLLEVIPSDRLTYSDILHQIDRIQE
jgi:hypothetical protein